VKLVNDNDGCTLTEDPEIMKRRSEYCENLCSDPENNSDEQARMGDNMEPAPP